MSRPKHPTRTLLVTRTGQSLIGKDKSLTYMTLASAAMQMLIP